MEIADTSLEEIQKCLCNSRVLVSVEGSYIAHAQLAMKSGSVIVVLNPHDRFTSVHSGYSRANEIFLGMVVLSGSERYSYYANVDEILEAIKLAGSSSAKDLGG